MTFSVSDFKVILKDLEDDIEEFVEKITPVIDESVIDPTFILGQSTSYLQIPSSLPMPITLPEAATISNRFGAADRATTKIVT